MRKSNAENQARYRERLRAKMEARHEEFMQEWREKGPIRFAEEFLTVPRKFNVKHPDYGKIPEHNVLSIDQKKFLGYLWKNPNSQIILSASRGSGKTFVIGLWVCWRLSTEKDYEITYMVGQKLEQTETLQDYVDDWRRNIPIVGEIISKSLWGNKRVLKTRYHSKANLLPCTMGSARSYHVNEVIIDEAVSGESRREGKKAVKVVSHQLIGRENTRFVLVSTTHKSSGYFVDVLKDPEKYGFKRFTWSLARHVSGKSSEETYTDKNPDHWLVTPTVWWYPKKKLIQDRIRCTDEDFLAEILGSVSVASGSVFRKSDIDFIVCDLCEECDPYGPSCKWNVIKPDLVRTGLDVGLTNALVITCLYRNRIFVLDSDELRERHFPSVVEWVKDHCLKWNVDTVYPDPSWSSQAVAQLLEGMGFIVINPSDMLGTKELRVSQTANWIQKRQVVIPKAYTFLIDSLRSLVFDDEGKIKKSSKDHQFDALCYALCDLPLEYYAPTEGISLKRKREEKSFTDEWSKIMRAWNQKLGISSNESTWKTPVEIEKAHRDYLIDQETQREFEEEWKKQKKKDEENE